MIEPAPTPQVVSGAVAWKLGKTGTAWTCKPRPTSTWSNPALTAALRGGGTTYTWAAATTGSNNAAGYQLASGEPVMAIGGFNGTDPAPSLARFEALVGAKKIHYYIPSGGGFGTQMGGSSVAGDIASWVASHYTAETLGGTTVYDLSRPAG